MKADAMKSELRFVLSFLSLASSLTTAAQAIAAEPATATIVPHPAKVEGGVGAVSLDASARIFFGRKFTKRGRTAGFVSWTGNRSSAFCDCGNNVQCARPGRRRPRHHTGREPKGSTFIHIGGDECPKDRWKKCPECQARIKVLGLKDERELQSYFIRRIEEHLASKGRRPIGWDEIFEGGLAPKATVMSWRGMNGALAAARSGHDYVATPGSHRYINRSYADFSLQKAYSFEPIPASLSADERPHCLGLQGNMWSEHIATPAKADYMIWPRLCALAEVGWSPKEARNWQDFQVRMESHRVRLSEMGVKAQ